MDGMEEDDKKESKLTLLERLSFGMVPYQIIDHELSTWTLSDGQLVITLIKRNAIHWKELYLGLPSTKERDS